MSSIFDRAEASDIVSSPVENINGTNVRPLILGDGAYPLKSWLIKPYPHKPSIETFFVIKVIISYDNFIAINPMKKFGARFSFSDFQGQKFIRQQEPGGKRLLRT